MILRNALIVTLLGFCLTACSTPGDQVRVQTMSVEDAWNGAQKKDLALSSSRIVTAAKQPSQPYPIITSPEIRMAYVKPFVDQDGNRHFGSWIAIQVDASKWVLPDGTVEPISVPVPTSQIAKPRK